MSAEIAGLPVDGDLPAGVAPVSAVAVVKGLDGDGNVQYYRLATGGTGNVEALGMHEAAAHLYKLAIGRQP